MARRGGLRWGLLSFVLGVPLLLVVALVLGALVIITDDHQKRSSDISNVSCDAAIGPTDPGQQDKGAVDASKLSDESKSIVAQIISIGKQRGMSPRAWQIAIQAGMTESGLRNLNHGDRDSLGIFQMRPSMGWGTVEQVTNIPYQINKFYDVLSKVKGWETMRPGDAAQAVERSGFPDRYHKWEPMAVHLVQNAGDVVSASSCTEDSGTGVLPPNQAAAKAIEFALAQQGKPYVWGATGPNSFDCSGLMLRAYEAAGVTIPRVSRDQYKAGAMMPVEQAQPGDLVFWAYDPSNPKTIHHVAMYLGDNKIVEAQQSGVPVHTRKLSWEEKELVAQAIRPGAKVGNNG